MYWLSSFDRALINKFLQASVICSFLRPYSVQLFLNYLFLSGRPFAASFSHFLSESCNVSVTLLQSVCGFLSYIVLVDMLNTVAAKIDINLGDNFRMRQLREMVSSNKLHSRRVGVPRRLGLNEKILDEIGARLGISSIKSSARRARQMEFACG